MWLWGLVGFKNGRPNPDGPNTGTRDMNIFQRAYQTGSQIELRQAAIGGGVLAACGVLAYYVVNRVL